MEPFLLTIAFLGHVPVRLHVIGMISAVSCAAATEAFRPFLPVGLEGEGARVEPVPLRLAPELARAALFGWTWTLRRPATYAYGCTDILGKVRVWAREYVRTELEDARGHDLPSRGRVLRRGRGR